jgi:hypothetical protein
MSEPRQTTVIRTPATESDRASCQNQLNNGKGDWIDNSTVVLQGRREPVIAEIDNGSIGNAYYEDRF